MGIIKGLQTVVLAHIYQTNKKLPLCLSAIAVLLKKPGNDYVSDKKQILTQMRAFCRRNPL